MMLGGDEFRRTQQGNNNAYCQDSEISWFDWDLAAKHEDMVRFWTKMIAFRKRFSALRVPHFYTGELNERGLPDIVWHGTQLNQAGWHDPGATALAFTIAGHHDEPDLHVILNSCYLPLDFELPELEGRQWFRVIDTERPAPDDIVDSGSEVLVSSPTYHAGARSTIVLMSKEK